MTTRQLPRAALLLALAGLLAACTTHVHQAYRPAAGAVQAMPVGLRPAYYDYRAPRPTVETYALPFQQVRGYEVTGIRFPSSERNGQPGNLVRFWLRADLE